MASPYSSPRGVAFDKSSDVPFSSPHNPLSTSSIPATPLSAQHHTPIRADLGGHRSHLVVAVSDAPSSSRIQVSQDVMQLDVSQGTDVPQQRLEIWGTSIHTPSILKAFKNFYFGFVDALSQFALYPRLLREAVESDDDHLNLNCQNLFEFDRELYLQMTAYPAEIIPLFDQFLDEQRKELLTQIHQDWTEERLQQYMHTRMINIRPFNLPTHHNMRELNPTDMDTLISIKGMVIRCGSIIPEMKTAFFQCIHCATEELSHIVDGSIAEPASCTTCQQRNCMQLIHNRCFFSDKQIIKIQETPDNVPEGETPHSVRICAYDELVDEVKPGDRVTITGIYKANSNRVNPRRSTLHTVYKPYIDAIHFKKLDQRRLQQEVSKKYDIDETSEYFHKSEESDITPEIIAAQQQKLQEYAARDDIYELLTRSIAPNIWELDNVKKGLLCMLFGGSCAESGADKGKFRGEINVLMCGDPGTSKSQLLQYVHKLAPRGIYTSGKGSSAVGLTASVTKDPESNEIVLESGALVLSDRGICCIDEFDKMSDATRSILHEVMEQQTVSIAKAGIVCTLNARTSILASANPKESRYNPKLSVVENIQIMPTLLSRFDLIYLILDQPNELKDSKLARHLVSLYYKQADSKVRNDVMSIEDLTAYISYARRHIKPQISDEARAKLIDAYTYMRSLGATASEKGTAKVITATPRQLEALIRLSEALAKMKLNSIVTGEDVDEAKRLMQVATQSAATDPKTGKIDMDSLMTGHSAARRDELDHELSALTELIESLKHKKRDRMNITVLLKEFNQSVQEDKHINLDDLKMLCGLLQAEGLITIAKDDIIITRK